VDGSAAGRELFDMRRWRLMTLGANAVTVPVGPTPSSFGCARLILFDQTRS
jgi:hypothetical protein